MSVNNVFDPGKIKIVDIKILKGQVDASELYDASLNEGFDVENTLKFNFSLEHKFVKTDLMLSIKSKVKIETQSNASAIFHLAFYFHIENLELLAIPNESNIIVLDPSLGNALSSISYSTSRGILWARLQGTVLNAFMLPVINPNDLLVSSIKK